jgi:hypothetical protein
MIIDCGLNNIKNLKEFLSSAEGLEFRRKDREETYEWIKKTLVKFRYLELGRRERGY